MTESTRIPVELFFAMNLMLPDEYQPVLKSRFTEMYGRIHRVLPKARIEHVGASAIPGAVSKGDLDICVLVHQLEHSASADRLVEHGYVEKAGTLRTESLCMLEWHQQREEHAIQLVALGSPFEMFMDFRDALLSDQNLVAGYNRVKQFASSGTEAEYRAAKSSFIERVLGDLRSPASPAYSHPGSRR